MTNSSDAALLKVAAEMTEQANAMAAQLATRQATAPKAKPEKSERKTASRSGQIIPRGKSFVVRIYLGRDANGKRKYSNKNIKTGRKNAEKYLTKALRDKDLGVFVEPGKETVSEFLARWLKTTAKSRVSERTLDGYESILSNAKPDLGSIRLSALRAADIQACYAKLTASNAKHLHAPLRSALNQAVRENLIHANPALSVTLPRHRAKEMIAFSRDEAARLMAVERFTRKERDKEVVAENRYRVMFAFMLTTGVRPSEAFALRWCDLDLEKATASITRTLQWHKGKGKGFYFDEPKTKGSRRSVPLPASLVRQLREHRAKQAAELLAIGIRTDLVFSNSEGMPLLRRNVIKRHYKPALLAAGLPTDARLYDLRHTCATLLLAVGVHPKVVSERLGHADVTLTLNVYSHVLPGMQQDATAQLERMLYG
jgi:integrase